MSLENAVTEIKRILEQDIFSPASREEIQTRRRIKRDIHPKEWISLSTRKLCQICGRVMGKGELYLYVPGGRHFSAGVCRPCIEAMNEEFKKLPEVMDKASYAKYKGYETY